MFPSNSEPSLPATIAATSLEGVFYGVFLTLFMLTKYLLVAKRPDGRNYPRSMHYASLFIFFFITVHWINSAMRLAQSLSFYPNEQLSTMALGDLEPSSRLNKDSVLVLMLIGNFMIVYRLWVIFNYEKRVVLLPFMGLLSVSLFAAVIFVEGFTPLQNLKSTKHHETFMAIGVYFSTICINFYSIALISWRVRKAEGSSWRFPRFSLVVAILIDNLVLFIISSTFYFILFITGSDAAPLADAISAPVIGIAFMLMNFRVWLGWLDGDLGNRPTASENDLLPKCNPREREVVPARQLGSSPPLVIPTVGLFSGCGTGT